jgi:hypothetical protein
MNKKILFFLLIFFGCALGINLSYANKINYPTSTIYTIRDRTRPVVYITSPVNGSTVSGTITLSANATDNVGVAGVQFLVDKIAFGNEINATPYEISLDTKNLKNGYHYISARARDLSGNTRTSSLIRIKVNNPLPTQLPNVSLLIQQMDSCFKYNHLFC